MARRISWTNNSSGHSGTYVYRAPTLDPQDLPAPVATVDPVAQGATAEWVDASGAYECYAVQDFDGSGTGTLSAEVCIANPFATAQVGDEIGGGIYAGTITYADGREFHVIAGKAETEGIGLLWGYSYVETTSRDVDDGQANQAVILQMFDDNVDYGSTPPEIFTHCRDLAVDGHSDWYVPAKNELNIVLTNLSGHAEFSDTTASGQYTYSSTEGSSNSANSYRFSDGDYNRYFAKDSADRRGVRPIRRIPV